MGTLLLVSFIFLVVIGSPIAFVLTGTTLLSQYFGTANPVMTVTAQQMFVGCDVFALLAIPLFMVAGSLMGEGGISHRLIQSGLGDTAHSYASVYVNARFICK